MARNAFRVGLRTDTPIPADRHPPAGITQELDPSDILEVQDLAEAIARAERIVAAPRSPQRDLGVPSLADMLETLGDRPTDDIIGAATPAPPPGFVTPVPPRYLTMPSTLPTIEDDAYYQPAGRMRSLADMTLDGYRPEPTLLLRAARRRRRFSWMFIAALLPLLVLAAVAIFARTGTASFSAMTGVASDLAGAHARGIAPAVAVRGKTPLATSSATSKAATSTNTVGDAAAAITGAGDFATTTPATTTPVFDVNSLPSAGTPRARR